MLPSLHGGGAERAAVQILNALDPAAWDRSMYLFRREGAYLDRVDAAIEIASGNAAARIGRWIALRRFVRRMRPQLVVAFLSYFSALTAARAAAVGARVVFNQQTPMSDFLDDADYRWRRSWRRTALTLATRIGYRLADAIVVTSNGVADDLVSAFGIARDRIRVLHNPVDLAAVAAAAIEPVDPAEPHWPSAPRIVAAGRLADAKNYLLMLDALALVRRTVPASLLVLGDGERGPAIREHAQRLGIGDAVVFAGFQRNPWKFIAQADVFALSSRYEGFGNVLIEAMACGVPVVATSSPGTRDIVAGGVNGLLVEKHQPAELAAALERLLTDSAMRSRMAIAARQTAERFALPAIAAEYGRVLGEVIA
ncbi:MAG TPA: glycosyltransferase [Vicinamibacterales bacterium]|nr:glycosyltransferase [Vicinamibacterales bacterium]